jgi:hypothetical protein
MNAVFLRRHHHRDRSEMICDQLILKMYIVTFLFLELSAAPHDFYGFSNLVGPADWIAIVLQINIQYQLHS